MAHLHIEYSAGTDMDVAALCGALHGAMIEAGIFPVAGIRVRAFAADYAIVADGLPENNFVAMTLSVGHGRSTQVLKAAGDILFRAAEGALAEPLSGTHFALSLEIREIHAELTWKNTPIHKRLSKD